MARARSKGCAGDGQLTQLTLDDAQAGEDDGDLRVVGPIDGLRDGQGAFQDAQGRSELA